MTSTTSGAHPTPTPVTRPVAPHPAAAHDELLAELLAVLEPDQVLARPIDRIRYASDASLYRLVPRAVVRPRDINDVIALFDVSRRTRVPITFRAAGTSLSGQAQGDGILIDVLRGWAGISVGPDGRTVRVRPGSLGGATNAALRRHGRALGPDPASIAACTVGGIIANNSSGMCCGVDTNAYRTLRSLQFVLPSGTVIDSAAPDAEDQFARAEPALATGLLQLRDALRADPELVATVQRKYSVKNTTGYGLNALLDFDTPLAIFVHLLVGSEGTLAFIAEASLDTVAVPRKLATGFVLFESLHAACSAAARLREAGARAVELMDRAALRAVAHLPGAPERIDELGRDAAALLIEVGADDEHGLDRAERAVRSAMPNIDGVEFTRDPSERARRWELRKGLFTAVGAARRAGTSVILEDITLPPAALAEGIDALLELCRRHGYGDVVLFGHAKEGNLHFLLTPDLGEDGARARYGAFMDELAQLVAVEHGGSLKGEHGTGRNIAPFVEIEWGAAATRMMRRIKHLADPDGLLNPDSVLTDHADLHLRDLKTIPVVDPEVDRCIECGYCERVCPSRDLSTTPRQRIALRRELARQDFTGDLADALEADFAYDAVDTCAGDGLCEIACPVAIDTGSLMKRLRAERLPRRAQHAGQFAARHWTAAERTARTALRLGQIAAALLGGQRLDRMLRLVRRGISPELVPSWLPDTPGPAHPAARRPDGRPDQRDTAHWVYLPACVNRIFGPPSPGPGVVDAFRALAARTGHRLWTPPDTAGTCCTTPWRSKGLHEGAEIMAILTFQRLMAWSDGGRVPIVTDATSCAHGFRQIRDLLAPSQRAAFDRLRLLDAVDVVADHMLDALTIRPLGSIAVHPVCAGEHTGGIGLGRIAAGLAKQVIVPPGSSCCGFAGDRGFLHPELTESATRPAAAYLAAHPADAYVTSNRTCEIGMSHGTGRPYRGVLEVLEERSRPIVDDRPISAFPGRRTWGRVLPTHPLTSRSIKSRPTQSRGPQ